jgi:dTDP-4-amino-4,6-dideoxygalactose transaminase
MNTDQLALRGGRPTRSKPWPKWPRADEETERALLDVLDSGRWTFSGFYHGTRCYERRFAEVFANYCGTRFCTPVASGSAGLITALQVLDVGPGDEVLVPAITWVACASTVVSVGARPVFVDVDRPSLCMSLADAKDRISSRTAAIMLVHAYCTVADLAGFVALSEATGIPLIEDCSQAHGSIWHGRRVGSFGTIGVFSMQQSKVLTCGEGEAVVCNDVSLYRRCEQLRADGRMFLERPVRVGFMELAELGEVQGQNRCLSEFHAAILLSRLKHLDEELKHREQMAEYMKSRLSQLPGVVPVERTPGTDLRSIYQYCIHIDRTKFANATVEAISAALSAELNATVEPLDTPLYRNVLYCQQRSRIFTALWNSEETAVTHQENLPSAEHVHSTCITFSHHLLLGTEEDIDDIISAILKVQRHSKDIDTFDSHRDGRYTV